VRNLNTIHKQFSLNGIQFKTPNKLISFIKTFDKEIYSFINDWFNTYDYIVVKTSGSTGTPKRIKIKKIFMKNSALATGTFFNLNEKTTALLCLSPNYIAGKMMLVRAITLGWHLDIVNPSVHPLDGNKKYYDFCAMVPMQAENSLAKLCRIKNLIIGGAPVNYELYKKLKNTKTNVYETYGMTETVSHIAIKPLSNSDFQTYFKILPDVYISQDNRGCLVIEAPKILDNKIITNDLVKIIDEKHFKWLGRVDNIINSGGIKIIPEEIEQKLVSFLDFRFFVAGLPDKLLGKKVVLICESKPKKIENIVDDKLTKFEKPKEIFFIKKFIETATHKINRKETLKRSFNN